MNCEAARAAMDEEFSGEELGERALPFREHLKTCASCRERFERLGRVDMALERGGLSEQRLDALQARVLGKLPVKAAPAVVPPPSRGWMVMLAAAAVVVLVASFTIPAWLSAGDDDFRPRGGGESWGVRAFCVKVGKVTAEALPGGTLHCAPGSLVQFTYTAPSSSQLSIAMTGTGQEFFPATSVDAGIDVSLPVSTPVGDWFATPQKVTARFLDASGKPVAESTLTISP